jgi:hypothetical protein
MTAHASPIKHHHAVTKAAHAQAQTAHSHAHAAAVTDASWNQYLAGGPLHWANAGKPVITAQIREMMHEGLSSADPVANPSVQYLLWRRSLDATRFDTFHPKIGRQLGSMLPPTYPSSTPQAQQLVPESTPTPSSVVTTPSSPTSITPTTPATAPDAVTPPANPSPAPSAIPEPGTLIMGLVMVGTGLWWRSRHRSRLG